MQINGTCCIILQKISFFFFFLINAPASLTPLKILNNTFFNTDEMFVTMEPILKQLTILDTLIRLEDTELFDFITE